MPEITRYTYLNLETRPDRKLLAQCTASRDGIPDELVHFWTGKDFETFDDLARDAMDNGVDYFKGFIGNKDKCVNTSLGQTYNCLLYFMDRVKRKDTLEVFCMMAYIFYHHLIMEIPTIKSERAFPFEGN